MPASTAYATEQTEAPGLGGVVIATSAGAGGRGGGRVILQGGGGVQAHSGSQCRALSVFRAPPAADSRYRTTLQMLAGNISFTEIIRHLISLQRTRIGWL